MKENDDVKVTVICTAYNHESYIKQCLDGFVMQKTNFKFEVIVHDDASTDRTADIIKEYEKKYPGIIVPIYQTENQYSQKKPFFRQILGLAKGKYIAQCEGDDYWTDCNKLQKQYDFMEGNPEVLLCLHTVCCVNEKGEALKHTHPRKRIKKKLISQSKFIGLVSSDFFQLTSFFCKRDPYEEYINNPPEFRKVSDVGDIPMLLFFTNCSTDIGYLDEKMSCYRGNAKDSWNSRQNTEEKWNEHFLHMEKMFNAFDEYSEYKFHSECMTGINVERVSLYVKKKDILAIMRKKELLVLFLKIYPMRYKISVLAHSIFRGIK